MKDFSEKAKQLYFNDDTLQFHIKEETQVMDISDIIIESNREFITPQNNINSNIEIILQKNSSQL